MSQHEIRCNILAGGKEEGGGEELRGEKKLRIEKDSLKVQNRSVIEWRAYSLSRNCILQASCVGINVLKQCGYWPSFPRVVAAGTADLGCLGVLGVAELLCVMQNLFIAANFQQVHIAPWTSQWCELRYLTGLVTLVIIAED